VQTPKLPDADVHPPLRVNVSEGLLAISITPPDGIGLAVLNPNV
jgi:hypothetical protein